MLPKKYSSGASKRKLAKNREDFKNKLPKLTNFFTATGSDSRVTDQPNHDIQQISEIPASVVEDNEHEKEHKHEHENEHEHEHDAGEEIVNDKVSSDGFKISATGAFTTPDVTLTERESANTDPALWPVKLRGDVRQNYLDKGCEYFQNRNSKFDASVRKYKEQNRFFSLKFCERTLANGEKYDRKWLIYSGSTGNIFCYVCKIFSDNDVSPFVKDGFSNWKKADEKICGHENSQDHKNCMVTWLTRMHETSHINKNLAKLVLDEINYWTQVLKRIVEVIKFLAERGLAFRGDYEIIGSPNNGNYLGILELLAKFDPFLQEHIESHANQGRGHVSYLSKTICEEFICMMAKKVSTQIVSEIKKAKYFGLIVDSTPDVSHIDQLSVVFRYCLEGQVHERFFCFLPINSHTGVSLSDTILQLLDSNDIDIRNCRAQTYDNASNMSGKYNGLQAHIKELNQLAYYVPCVGHSLNLVGQCSVDECTDSINFFGFLQRLYAFFVASTHRWAILLKHVNTALKSLSATRWSCRDDATSALVENYKGVFNALGELAENQSEKSDTRHEAASLRNKLEKLETAFMTVFWHRVLQRFNATSKFLQTVELDLITANNMLHSLVTFVDHLRNDFTVIEKQSKELGDFVRKDYCDNEKRKTIRRCADNVKETQTVYGSDRFRIRSFYIMVDKLYAELKKRSSAYNDMTALFGFLNQLNTLNIDQVRERANNLVKVYSRDLEPSLECELEQFIPLIKSHFDHDGILTPVHILKWMIDRQIEDVFPNVCVAFRLFLTVPITNCEAERSFSKLTIIKNKYRSTMTESRLSSLALLAIESKIFRTLDFDDLIADFSREKARKKRF